ncbi:hypothetical protein JCM14469_05590 [Desulfatiferula olefinivorans]
MSIYKDQRTMTRTPISGEIQYARGIRGERFDARLFDCSPKGLGLISNYPYLRDTELILRSKNDRDDTIQRARVAWSRPLSRSMAHHPRYRVGVTFA